MQIRRVILKLSTCAVGGVVLWLACSVIRRSTGGVNIMDSVWDVIWRMGLFAAFGLVVGTAWAIENQKARRRFGWSVGVGFVLAIGLWVWNYANNYVFLAVFTSALFVGIVLALSSVGAYGKKRAQVANDDTE